MKAPIALALAALGVSLASAAPAPAQAAGDGFLFSPPLLTLSVRGGFDRAFAGSDLFSFTTDQLTVGKGDFSGPAIAGDLAIRLLPRLDLVLSSGYSGTETASEFRDFVDNNDQPIEQRTRFERVPATAGLRAYLTPRGERIGSLAWVPNRVVPYVGAGAGGMWYRFRQEGDFVDFETYDVFYEELDSSGWTVAANASAGLDVTLTPRLGLTTEARYGWGRAEAGNAFTGFDPIDLSGLSATVGFNLRI